MFCFSCSYKYNLFGDKVKLLPEKAGEPDGVYLGKAGVGGDGGVTGKDGAGVFVDVEAHVDDVHLAVQREGHDDVVVGTFRAHELEGGIGGLGVLGGEFLACYPLAHFHDGIFKAGGENVHLLDELAGLPHEAESIALKLLHGLFRLRRRDCISRKEPYHQPSLRVMIKGLVLQEVAGAAVWAFGNEKGTVPDPGLKRRVKGGIDALVNRRLKRGAAV